MSNLKFIEIMKKMNDLCDFTETVINSTDLIYREGLDKETVLKEISEIKTQIQSARKFTIAFVGEYNSGKTSIINLLTGNDFQVSSTVATQTANVIQWKENLNIVDTPGLGSGLAEHDEITKQWLAKADILVYVLTPDLFNRHSGGRFLAMLEKYKRDHELMLVMNMIDQEGNEIDVYRNELQSVIAPKTLDEFFPAFISAKYKRCSMDSKFDDEERAYYLEKSRFDSFLETLNHFIMDRKEKASITTPLTRLHTLLHKIAFKNKFDQENTLLEWKIRIYGEHLVNLKSAFGDFRSRLQDYASGTAGEIFMALDNPSSDFQDLCQTKLNEFIDYIEKSVRSIRERASNIVEQLKKEGEKIDHSDLAKEVEFRIERSEKLKCLFNVIPPDAGKKGGNTNENILREFRNQIGQLDSLEFNGKKIYGEIESVLSSKNLFQAGSKLLSKIEKGMVLKAGHAFGKKFRPWEAVKLTSKIGKAVPIFNAAGVIWETTSYIREKKHKDESNFQLGRFKGEIKDLLDDAVNTTAGEVKKDLLKPVEIVLENSHKMFQDKKKELIEYADGNKKLCEALEDKKQQCLNLYTDIYGN